MKDFVKLPKLKAGDQVAVVSPAGDAAGRFPWVYKYGIERMEQEFGLKPKAYPTTLQIGPSPEERAKDLMAAFADPDNKAVIATLGGFDQVRVLKHLKSDVFIANPKPFFGYSDNTHFINYLWDLGIPAYYGGAVMIQFGHAYTDQGFTTEYLRYALFDEGKRELSAPARFSDETRDWSDQENWQKPNREEDNPGWLWDGQVDTEGILWGGCAESMVVKFASGLNIPDSDALDGVVLFLETSEEVPPAWTVEYVLMGMGERGWFDKLKAVLFGRPKAWYFDKQFTLEQKVAYREEQQKTVIDTIRLYNKDIPIVQGLDFGHTAPQLPVPSGKKVTILSGERKIYFDY